MFTDPQNNLRQFGISSGMKVADFGAGSGFYSIEAGMLVGAVGKILAVDVQKELLERLKNQAISQKVRNIEIIWGDIERIGGTKIKDGFCDRVIFSNVLFQLEHKADACLEAKRILKPGGKVLVVDWSIGAPTGPANFVQKQDAIILFERSGFVFDKEILAGDHHYGLIFKKND